MVTFLGMVSVPGRATIIDKMANDHSRDGGHHLGRLESFDHFGEGDLHRAGDHPMIGDHHRDGNHPRDCGHPKDFCNPTGWLLS